MDSGKIILIIQNCNLPSILFIIATYGFSLVSQFSY